MIDGSWSAATFNSLRKKAKPATYGNKLDAIECPLLAIFKNPTFIHARER